MSGADPLAPYEDVFQAAAQSWNIDPLLLKAVAMQESNGNPRAVSPAGAQGLMQIMPATAKSLGVTNPFDPVESIFGAAKYLDEALRTEKTPEDALRFYHGGPGWRGAYGKESREYVPNVGRHYQRFKAEQEAAKRPTPAPAPAPRDKE